MAKTFYLEELTAVGLNPYEAVVAASKEARRLNTVRLMSDTAEGTEKMTTIALDRVVKSQVKVDLGYADEETDSEEDSAGS
jgi:DNA-directed RNA polymerase subunit K/omega